MKRSKKKVERILKDAVRELRELLCLSQHQLALKLGIQTAMISHWETTVLRVSHKNLWKMAMMAPGTDLCWFFLEEDGISKDAIRNLAKSLNKPKRRSA